MSCASKFEPQVSLTCILQLVNQVRQGPTRQTLTQALWIAGCLIEQLSPPTLPEFEVQDVRLLDTTGEDETELDVLLNRIEAQAELLNNNDVGILAGEVGTQGWEVLIPLVLELIKLIMERRKK